MNPQLVDFNEYILGMETVVGENDDGNPTINTGHHSLTYNDLTGDVDDVDLGSIESIPYGDRKLPAVEEAAAEDSDAERSYDPAAEQAADERYDKFLKKEGFFKDDDDDSDDSDDDDDEFNEVGNNGGVVASEGTLEEDIPSGVPKVTLMVEQETAEVGRNGTIESATVAGMFLHRFQFESSFIAHTNSICCFCCPFFVAFRSRGGE